MLSSLRPYKLTKREGDGFSGYEFTTDSGVVYKAYFLDMASYAPHFESVYTFNFETDTPAAGYDGRVADTICTLLCQLFTDNRNAVVFICDNTDERERGRNRLFQQWYHYLGEISIDKIDRHCTTTDYDIYSSLLIHQENPKRALIVESFEALVANALYPIE